MMMRKMGMMAGLLVLAACGDKGGADAAQEAAPKPGVAGAAGNGQIAMPTTVFSEHSFTPIPPNPPTPCEGKAGAPVTWTLEKIFLGLDSNRRVKRLIKRGGADVKEIPPNEVGSNWPTNLDMDISSPGSDYVMVTIVLQTGATSTKPGVHFLRPRSSALPNGPDPGGTDSSAAVLTPAPKGGAIEYCGRTPIDTSVAGIERVSFGVRNAPDARSLNIGLLVPTRKTGSEPQMWLPIFLDPNIRNKG